MVTVILRFTLGFNSPNGLKQLATICITYSYIAMYIIIMWVLMAIEDMVYKVQT